MNARERIALELQTLGTAITATKILKGEALELADAILALKWEEDGKQYRLAVVEVIHGQDWLIEDTE